MDAPPSLIYDPDTVKLRVVEQGGSAIAYTAEVRLPGSHRHLVLPIIADPVRLKEWVSTSGHMFSLAEVRELVTEEEVSNTRFYPIDVR